MANEGPSSSPAGSSGSSNYTWTPKRSLAECQAILIGPGSPLEVEHVLCADGIVRKFYKHAPPSMRAFWIAQAATHANATFIVYENERYTYQETFDRASHAASIFREVYGIRKGDRIALVMRNYAEWIFTYWAAILLGAVPVLVNAWLPGKVLAHCITHTTSKLIVTDAERATRLAPFLSGIITSAGSTGVLVVVKPRDHVQGKKDGWKVKEGREWDHVMQKYDKIGKSKAWEKEPVPEYEENGTIYFTSGTTGLPKGVLLTQRVSISALFQGLASAMRAALRRGDSFESPTVQRAFLMSVPLFHATGSMSAMLTGVVLGGKLVLMDKWDVQKAMDLIENEGITSAGGVPSIAIDLLNEPRFRQKVTLLEAMSYGGAPGPPAIPQALLKMPMPVHNAQGYGLTETAAAVCNFMGEDSSSRPLSTGLVGPTSDIIIVDPKTKKSLPTGQRGEIWIKGPQIMKEYYKDPEATRRVLTKDGWFNSEDIGYFDEEGFLYVSGRVKDLIIRGGENIDAITIENALYDDSRILSAAAVGVPDTRLGELPAVFVHPADGQDVTEEELLDFIRPRLPAHALPVLILVSKEPLETNAAGKILKDPLRKKARQVWEKRRVSARSHTSHSKQSIEPKL